MFREGTNENDVRMEDVLCDFCHRAWTEREPFLEGHRGTHICGKCLSVACAEIDADGPNVVTSFFCRMSRESDEDRAAMNRGDERGWQSPVDPEACVSRMCIRMAAAALERDADFEWVRP